MHLPHTPRRSRRRPASALSSAGRRSTDWCAPACPDQTETRHEADLLTPPARGGADPYAAWLRNREVERLRAEIV